MVNGKNFYLPLALNDVADGVVPAETRSTFSQSLGWEPNHPNDDGYRGEVRDIDGAVLAVFGDSCTQGYPVIKQSWPDLLERKLGRPVLNFGVGGYGPDQAYLRFEERYAGRITTPYVALLIMSENIGRAVNRYRGFYLRLRHVSFTKPMFRKGEEGAFTLLPNPLRSPDEFKKLGDSAFLEEIGTDDYWYRYFGDYDLNQYVGFPYAYYLVKALPYYVKRFYENRIKLEQEHGVLYQDPDALAVYRDYVLDLKARRQAHVFDALDFFASYLKRGEDASSFFISNLNGHYNPKGESVVSEGIYRILLTPDAERTWPGPGKASSSASRLRVRSIFPGEWAGGCARSTGRIR